ATARLGLGTRQISAIGDQPSVSGPVAGIEQRLAPERPVTILVTVIDEPPRAVGSFDRRRMTSRPPALGGAHRAYDRIVGRVLPRTVNRTRARHDHHVAGGRSGGATDREDQVEPFAAPENLRS